MTTTTGLSDLTGDYTLDLADTRIGFVAGHTVGPKVRGRFDQFTAVAYLDGGDPANSRIELTIQADSIQTHNPQRDGYLRRKYLSTADHPTITFTSTQVKQVDASGFLVTGELTVRGVTNPVTMNVELTSASDNLHFKASATINRKDWGVQWSADVGLVSKTVALDLDITATRRP